MSVPRDDAVLELRRLATARGDQRGDAAEDRERAGADRPGRRVRQELVEERGGCGGAAFGDGLRRGGCDGGVRLRRLGVGAGVVTIGATAVGSGAFAGSGAFGGSALGGSGALAGSQPSAAPASLAAVVIGGGVAAVVAGGVTGAVIGAAGARRCRRRRGLALRGIRLLLRLRQRRAAQLHRTLQVRDGLLELGDARVAPRASCLLRATRLRARRALAGPASRDTRTWSRPAGAAPAPIFSRRGPIRPPASRVPVPSTDGAARGDAIAIGAPVGGLHAHDLRRFRGLRRLRGIAALGIVRIAPVRSRFMLLPSNAFALRLNNATSICSSVTVGRLVLRGDLATACRRAARRGRPRGGVARRRGCGRRGAARLAARRAVVAAPARAGVTGSTAGIVPRAGRIEQERVLAHDATRRPVHLDQQVEIRLGHGRRRRDAQDRAAVGRALDGDARARKHALVRADCSGGTATDRRSSRCSESSSSRVADVSSICATSG